jgi:hypothetical protein
MRTDDWIDALATGLEPVPAGQPARRLMGALALGTVLAVLAVVLGYGVRPDWADALQQPVMWLKLGFPALLAAAAGVVLWRLSVPGRLPGALAWAWLPLTLAMSGLGLWVLMRAEASQRNMLWMGQTWGSCTLSIAAVSLPVLAALLLAVRTLAPTQLRWAGAMAGVLSGASGTLAYAIYCPEMAVPFLALWNTLAIVLMALLGTWLGPRTLRW